jgi:hypothetical protein
LFCSTSLISPPSNMVGWVAVCRQIIEGVVGHQASKASANVAGEVRKLNPRIPCGEILLNTELVPLRPCQAIKSRQAPFLSAFKYSGSWDMGGS